MKKISLLSFLFLLFLPLTAQEIQVVSTKAPEQTPFAQPFQIQVDFAHEVGATVQADEKSFSPDFEVTQIKQENPSPATTLITFTVIPFALKSSTFTASFDLLENGQKTAQTTTEIPLTVMPVKLFDDQEIKEIRPPHLPFNVASLFLALLVAGGLVAFIVWWANRKKKIKSLSIAQAQDNRSAQEIALSQINALIDSGLWEQQKYKLFYITLCDILRQYLWKQLKLDTSADTSLELLHRARTCPELQPLLPRLKEFLNSSDLVKFAQVTPSNEECERDISSLRTIVDETTPKPVITQEEVK